MSAEGMRDWCDDANFTNAILKAVASSGFAESVRNFHQRSVFAHATQNLVESNNSIWRPDTALFQRHEFDEANYHSFFTREHAEGNNLILIKPTHQYTIDFHRPQTRTA